MKKECSVIKKGTPRNQKGGYGKQKGVHFLQKGSLFLFIRGVLPI